MDIVDRLRENEEVALIELMNQYGAYLKRTAYLILKDEQLAEEVVQDTFIKAFHSIRQLREKEKLKGWLTQITYNLCRSYLRKKKITLFSIEKDNLTFKDEKNAVPEEHLLQLAASENLSNAVLQLDDKYREVIVLHYYNAYSIKEIKNLIMTKENTIKSRLARARQQLYQLLTETEWDQ